MGIRMQQMYPMDVLRAYYYITPELKTCPKLSLVCHCSKQGCGTLFLVQYEEGFRALPPPVAKGSNGQELPLVHRIEEDWDRVTFYPFDWLALGETALKNPMKQFTAPRDMWLGTCCINEMKIVSTEFIALWDIRRKEKDPDLEPEELAHLEDLARANYLKNLSITDEAVTAMFMEKCYGKVVPAAASLGRVASGLREAGRLNTLIAYIKNPSDKKDTSHPREQLLVETLLKCSRNPWVKEIDTNLHWRKIAVILRDNPRKHSFGTLPEVLLSNGRWPRPRPPKAALPGLGGAASPVAPDAANASPATKEKGPEVITPRSPSPPTSVPVPEGTSHV
jgi:hypothetical protein